MFRFVKSKGDQTGRNSDQEWHVYANPHNPEICAVLALACYIFSNPEIFSAADVEEDEVLEVEGGGVGNQKKGGQLFPGGNQYDRFMECLHRIVGKYPQVILGLGISPGNLGSHSARKGAVMLAVDRRSCRQWCPSVCARCGQWATSKSDISNMKRPEINTLGEWYVASMLTLWILLYHLLFLNSMIPGRRGGGMMESHEYIPS